MVKIFSKLILMSVSILLIVGLYGTGMADDSSIEMENLKLRVKQLEKIVEELEKKSTKQQISKSGYPHYHSVKGLEDRIQRMEKELKERSSVGNWTDRINVSGLLEVEAGWENINYRSTVLDDEDGSDIALATAELDVDVAISKYVAGHIAFLWEEDDTEPVDIDEAYILLDGKEVIPFYLSAGKMYIPFGWFESHFISDPITLEIGETRESALKVGFVKDWFELSGALFNGDINKAGEDDHIKGWVIGANVKLPENTPGHVGFNAGISYINNIGESDGLRGEDGLDRRDVNHYVSGLSSFLSLSFNNKIFLEGEYIVSLDEFETGELGFNSGKRAKPRAWNIELAYLFVFELALKYEGSDDLGDFQPEDQWGGAVTYQIFENTSLALEYLHGEFETGDKRDMVTAQISVEF